MKKAVKVVYEAVVDRSGGRCEARLAGICTLRASHVHHRRLRSQGGAETEANLLHVCSECHSWAHMNPEQGYALGLLVHGWDDPEVVPIDRHGCRFEGPQAA